MVERLGNSTNVPKAQTRLPSAAYNDYNFTLLILLIPCHLLTLLIHSQSVMHPRLCSSNDARFHVPTVYRGLILTPGLKFLRRWLTVTKPVPSVFIVSGCGGFGWFLHRWEELYASFFWSAVSAIVQTRVNRNSSL